MTPAVALGRLMLTGDIAISKGEPVVCILRNLFGSSVGWMAEDIKAFWTESKARANIFWAIAPRLALTGD